MKKKNLTFSNIFFAIFVVLLIIPQSRMAMQVALNKVKVQLFSPSTLAIVDQSQLEPFSYQLTTIDNGKAVAETGKGKVTFLSYWATWCPPCIAEMPSIQKLYTAYGDRVDFILLTNEGPDIVRAFLDERAFDLPVFIPQMRAPEKLYERSIPTTYIIDKKGKIIVKETGAADWNSKKARDILDELIAN